MSEHKSAKDWIYYDLKIKLLFTTMFYKEKHNRVFGMLKHNKYPNNNKVAIFS